MPFKLLNEIDERGDYAFSGHGLPSRACNLNLSQKDIQDIKRQVEAFTKKHPRDYILYFENERQERVIAIDNISLDEMKERKRNGESLESIKGLNHYDILFDYEMKKH